MKIFNEVTADVSGRVVEIHVGGGQLVQQGETLLSVEAGGAGEQSAEAPAPVGGK